MANQHILDEELPLLSVPSLLHRKYHSTALKAPAPGGHGVDKLISVSFYPPGLELYHLSNHMVHKHKQ